MGEIVFLSSYEKRPQRKLLKSGPSGSKDLNFIGDSLEEEKPNPLTLLKDPSLKTFVEKDSNEFAFEHDKKKPPLSDFIEENIENERQKQSYNTTLKPKKTVIFENKQKDTQAVFSSRTQKSNIIDLQAYRRKKHIKSPRFYLPSWGNALQTAALAFVFMFAFHFFNNESERGLAQVESLTPYSARAHLKDIVKNHSLIAGKKGSSDLQLRSPDSVPVEKGRSVKHLQKITHKKEMILGKHPSSSKYQGF